MLAGTGANVAITVDFAKLAALAMLITLVSRAESPRRSESRIKNQELLTFH